MKREKLWKLAHLKSVSILWTEFNGKSYRQMLNKLGVLKRILKLL